MKIILLFLSLLTQAIRAQISYLNYDCYRCYSQDQGRYCLTNGKYSEGTCCHQQYPTYSCQNQGFNRFCLSRESITNGIIGDYVCPANNQKCPSAASDVEISISEKNKYYERVWKWNQTVPLNDAFSWFCKYIIQVPNRNLLTYSTEEEKPMLVIQVEPYNFDEQVWLITQPHRQFRDYKYKDITNIYKGFFHKKYYLPAEYDVLVSFMPTKALNGLTSTHGQFKIRVMLQGPLTEAQKLDPDAKILLRPEEKAKLEEERKKEEEEQKKQEEAGNDGDKDTSTDDAGSGGTTEDEKNKDETTDEDKKKEDSNDQTENTDYDGVGVGETDKVDEIIGEDAETEEYKKDFFGPNATRKKVNWEGEEVPTDKSWIDKELFMIGDYQVTAQDAVVSSTVLIIIIIVIVLVCMFISWRKRKAIAAGARRASTFIIRQSQKLRNTIKEKMGRPVDERPEIEVNPDRIGRNKNEKQFLKDMFQYQSGVDVFEGENSGMNSDRIQQDEEGLPKPAEFQMGQFQSNKKLIHDNQVRQSMNVSQDRTVFVNTEVVIKNTDANDDEVECNIDSENANENNDKILFNQQNFLKEMQGYQSSQYDQARKLTFGQDNVNSRQKEIENMKIKPGSKTSKSLYVKGNQMMNKDKKEGDDDVDDPDVKIKRSKSIKKPELNKQSLDGYNNFFSRTQNNNLQNMLQNPNVNQSLEQFRGRGLTKIKELLMDFQDDDDFLVSQRQPHHTETDGQTDYNLNDSNIFQGSNIFNSNVYANPGDPGNSKEGFDPDQLKKKPQKSARKSVKSSVSQGNFLDLLEESKKMLYDIKLMDDTHQERMQQIREEIGGEEQDNPLFYPDKKNPKNPLEMNVQFTDESRDMEFDKDDQEYQDFQDFQSRKQTIVENMSKLIDARYPEEKDESKRSQLINHVKESLDEEEKIFKLTAVQIRTHNNSKSKIPTLKKKTVIKENI